jgi:DNA-binding MarR family transcriptional regulator
MANIPPDDAELEHVLTRLLRMVSPGFTAENNVPVSHSGEASDETANVGSAGPPPAGTDGAGGPVSASEARALIELVSARGIAQGELAGLLGLDKSTVSRLAASLERRGWVRRGRDEVNQRYVRLYLTPAGGEAAGRVWQAWQARQARILAAMSEDERAGLAAGLRGLIRGLSADRETGPAPGSAARQSTGFTNARPGISAATGP